MVPPRKKKLRITGQPASKLVNEFGMRYRGTTSSLLIRSLLTGFGVLLILSIAVLLFLPIAKTFHQVSQLRQIVPEQGDRVIAADFEFPGTTVFLIAELRPGSEVTRVSSFASSPVSSAAVAVRELSCVHRC